MRSRIPLIALCSVGLFVPVLIPLVLGRVFSENDLITYHIPIRYLYAKALHAGDSPVWWSAMYSGLYALGESQAGIGHPIHFLWFKYLPLTLAINLELISGYLAALVGSRMLLGRLGLSRESAWFGGMVFAFSGFNLLRLIHLNVVEIIGHLPWVLLCVHVLLTSESRRARASAFAGTSLLIGSQLLLFYPQYVWLTLLAAGYLALCLLINGAPLRRLVFVAGAIAGGALIGAVQLLPTLEALRTSMRSDPSLAFRLTFSLNPLNLIQLFSPYAFEKRIYAHPFAFEVHESSVYNGAFCTLAMVWVAIRYRALERRRLINALAVLAAVSLLFALGRYGGVYAWIAQLPVLSWFRAPARHVLLLHLAMSGMAAVAFEDLAAIVRQGVKLEWRKFRLLAIPVGVSLAMTFVAGSLAGSSWARSLNLMFSDLPRAAAGMGLVMLTAALLVMAGRGVRWAISLLVILVALDLGLWGYLYAYSSPARTIPEMAASADAPPEARPGELVEPIRGTNLENVTVLRDLRISMAYVALVPASALDPADPASRRLAGVNWRHDGKDWIRLADAMPRARLVSRAERSENIPVDVRRIDVSQTALTAQPIGDLSGEPGQVQVIADRPGRLVFRTSATGPQLLVVTERFHPGWRGTQDDRECRPIPVYGDFLGCVVGPGTHDVTFTFAPQSLRTGLRLTLAGLAWTLVCAGFMWRGVHPGISVTAEKSLPSA